ncbi:MAG TPA: HNH endonuclease [Rhodocyclaceae bacterium]|nr:HNH endonuclease [Rhodocyclaceae bacterium]
MSNPDVPHAPSFISHDSISFSEQEEPLAPLKRFLSAFAQADQLDSETFVSRRKEQAFLRSYLLRGKGQGECVLCGRTLPRELLVAAHIKARSECSRDERLDFDNVAALMCVLGCDSLFDKGFVYAPDGCVRVNSRREGTPHLDNAISQIEGRTVANWSNSSLYYQWHAKEFGWKSN